MNNMMLEDGANRAGELDGHSFESCLSFYIHSHKVDVVHHRYDHASRLSNYGKHRQASNDGR